MDSLYDTQFAQTISTPAMISSLTPPPTIDPSSTTTIKMEDLQVPFGTSSQAVPPTSDPSQPAAPEGKSAKKRKSWGQVLPEPKTNLPPRKRAKTEDEKEQRRIERVKRNRLAAHNSRERKRQEYELLQAEKDKLEDELKLAQLTMARMGAELKTYRQKYPGEVPESTFDFEASTPSTEFDSFSSHNDTINPAATTSSTGFPSPVSMTMDSMDSPRDSSCAPETPDFSEPAADFDQTRYPAVSVDVSGSGLALSNGDLGFPYSLQPHTQSTLDEKPLESLFDFDQFPENNSNNACSVEPSTGLVDGDVFFSSALFGHHDPGFGLSDHLDAKHFDLQTASGATFVSDEALAA